MNSLTYLYDVPSSPLDPIPRDGGTMSDKTVVLPNAQAMMNRLMGVADNRWLRHDFYPLLLQHAGSTQTAEGIVRLLEDCIGTCATRKTDRVRLTIHAIDFLEAIIPDREVAREAIRISVRERARESALS